MEVPRLPLALLRAWLPYAERDEVIAELRTEFVAREVREGPQAARAWLWRQVLGSVPPLVRRTFSRGWTGFEPRASRLRPGGPPMESFIMDLRYAARRLRSRPGYALLAILTLAIGVGGTAAAFGLVRGLLMTPLPYPAEERLSLFWSPGDWSEREFLHLSSDWSGFNAVAAFRTKELPLRRGPQASPELVTAIVTSAGLFDVLGVRPTLGRAFEANEDRPGAAPAVVISDGLYGDLGGQPSLVGGTVELDGRTHTVVGVMPRGFWFPDPTVRAWVVEPFNEEDGSGNYALMGRRAPGVDGPRLELTLKGLGTRLRERFNYPAAWDKGRAPAVTPLREHLLGPLQAPLLATLAAMGVLLLIACANVAALMLGQVDSRATELAVRMALGADSRRMTQQLLAEALLLGLASAALGALIAAQGFRVLTGALPLGPLAPKGALDWGMFSAALVLALVAALAVALLPARSLRKSDPQRALAKSRTGGIGARGGRTEGALVIGQVALAVLLTAGAALLVRSVANLRAIDPGLNDTARVAVLDVVMEGNVERDARPRIISDLEAALATLPGVRGVGTTQKLPLRGAGEDWGIGIVGKPDLPATTTYVRLVSPGYFDAVGIRLVDGRLLHADDRVDSERAVVINRALAKKYFPGENPLGQQINTGLGGLERIVGVVEDVAEAGLTDGAVPARYMLHAQVAGMTMTRQTLVLRAWPGQDPAALLDAARKQLAAAAPSVAVHRATTLEAVLTQAIGPARQVMSVLTLLTALAVVLGAVGVYGVTSHFVRRRQRDLGICIALGLRPSRVVAQVVRRGGVLVLIGSALGTVAALVLARLLSSFLYGVSAVDPLSLAGATLALLAVGVLAALLPALRASRLDPAVVFREG
ncbi:ADOP family duplicated permease [Pyxidicoccus xibeiensis]|uniref:ADOP family duplicated permease n=1 Tax=Pyxidicoccus xibeiensis TaxID=2906759 RepID=UPI0020A710FB|nr:ADOP family duplicated permease [Pyxidicoccus xibeiensis]MCP3141856.1 ADOP family duplicated permease [Pyxidicoccus xibeiensis]